MCSLLHGGGVGYLLDAGAGVPVRRGEYRSGVHVGGRPFVNQLRSTIQNLNTVMAILSHPDSDHWRLLDWDSGLLSATSAVCLPAGQPALAFSAPAIKGKVVGLSNHSFSLNAKNSLEVLRANPSHSDRNGECLVAIVDCNGTFGLAAGDYVYSRMLTDGNMNVVNLANRQYDAIIVPHHGDAASANNVPSPVVPHTSKAFFSAGTHAGYGHPTTNSINAHIAFDRTNKNTTDDVLELPLLP